MRLYLSLLITLTILVRPKANDINKVDSLGNWEKWLECEGGGCLKQCVPCQEHLKCESCMRKCLRDCCYRYAPPEEEAQQMCAGYDVI